LQLNSLSENQTKNKRI